MHLYYSSHTPGHLDRKKESLRREKPLPSLSHFFLLHQHRLTSLSIMADPLIGMSISFGAVQPQKPDAPRGGLGSQVLPVADLEENWDGSPEDGSQYLALVRCA
jgi:hypothetical protein